MEHFSIQLESNFLAYLKTEYKIQVHILKFVGPNWKSLYVSIYQSSDYKASFWFKIGLEKRA